LVFIEKYFVYFQDGYDDSFLLKAATSETVIILWLIGIIVFQVSISSTFYEQLLRAQFPKA
jgi:hypothetical protein